MRCRSTPCSMDQSHLIIDLIEADIEKRRKSGECLQDIAQHYNSAIPGIATLLRLSTSDDPISNSLVAVKEEFRSLSGYDVKLPNLPSSLPSVSVSVKPPSSTFRDIGAPSTSVPLLSCGYAKVKQETIPSDNFAASFDGAELRVSHTTVDFGDNAEDVNQSFLSNSSQEYSSKQSISSRGKRRKFEVISLINIVSPDPSSSSSGGTASRSQRQRTERVPFDPLSDVSILKERDFATPEHAQSRLDDIAFNELRDQFGKEWKKVHGKGQHKDWHRYIYLNPQGKKYTLTSGAKEGIDFFLTPQAALEYCRKEAIAEFQS